MKCRLVSKNLDPLGLLQGMELIIGCQAVREVDSRLGSCSLELGNVNVPLKHDPALLPVFIVLLPTNYFSRCQVSAVKWPWLAPVPPPGILVSSAMLLRDRNLSLSPDSWGRWWSDQFISSFRPWVLDMAHLCLDCPLAHGWHQTH